MNQIVKQDPDDYLATLTREKFLAGVDEAIQNLYKTGDVRTAVRVLSAFGQFEDMSGFGKAKFLYGAQHWFKDTKQDGDFYDTFGINDNKNDRIYADRLIRLWKCIADEQVPKKVQRRTVRELLPITEALSQGYEISKEIWNKLEQAINEPEIREIIQTKVKGKKARSHTINLTVDDSGTITAWHKNKPYFIGSLNMTEREKEPVIDKAITRILLSANIREK